MGDVINDSSHKKKQRPTKKIRWDARRSLRDSDSDSGFCFNRPSPQVETRSSPVSPEEQTRSLEVLDRNMQNVSREITAILSKIEEDGLGPTVC